MSLIVSQMSAISDIKSKANADMASIRDTFLKSLLGIGAASGLGAAYYGGDAYIQRYNEIMNRPYPPFYPSNDCIRSFVC